MSMRISVIGIGYLGAVHAAAMAELGHHVIGLDTDPDRVRMLQEGHAPFHEPGFDALLRRGLETGRLRFTTDYADLADAEVHFLGVGTPQRADGMGADLTFVRAATAALAEVLTARQGAPTLVVGKSTVPAGTARELAPVIERIDGALLMWNPEFLRESFAIQDTLEPDRLVYGIPAPDATDETDDERVRILDRVYAPILERGTPRMVMGFETAELVKVSANAFLATKISFINAVAEMCEAVGGDVTAVSRAVGMDDRIGAKFLRAGIGFGGGCLPKDIRALLASAEENGAGEAFGFLREVDAINTRRRDRVVGLARDLLDADRHGGLHGRRITVLGAAFKPNSDDVRDSPALEIAARLLADGADVRVTDPQALRGAARSLGATLGATFDADALQDVLVEDTDEALHGAELVLLLTEWDEYRHLDPARTARLVDTPRIIDGRGVLDPQQWSGAGWAVHALGRPAAAPAATNLRAVAMLASHAA